MNSNKNKNNKLLDINNQLNSMRLTFNFDFLILTRMLFEFVVQAVLIGGLKNWLLLNTVVVEPMKNRS